MVSPSRGKREAHAYRDRRLLTSSQVSIARCRRRGPRFRPFRAAQPQLVAAVARRGVDHPARMAQRFRHTDQRPLPPGDRSCR